MRFLVPHSLPRPQKLAEWKSALQHCPEHDFFDASDFFDFWNGKLTQHVCTLFLALLFTLCDSWKFYDMTRYGRCQGQSFCWTRFCAPLMLRNTTATVIFPVNPGKLLFLQKVCYWKRFPKRFWNVMGGSYALDGLTIRRWLALTSRNSSLGLGSLKRLAFGRCCGFHHFLCFFFVSFQQFFEDERSAQIYKGLSAQK